MELTIKNENGEKEKVEIFKENDKWSIKKMKYIPLQPDENKILRPIKSLEGEILQCKTYNEAFEIAAERTRNDNT